MSFGVGGVVIRGATTVLFGLKADARFSELLGLRLDNSPAVGELGGECESKGFVLFDSFK